MDDFIHFASVSPDKDLSLIHISREFGHGFGRGSRGGIGVVREEEKGKRRILKILDFMILDFRFQPHEASHSKF